MKILTKLLTLVFIVTFVGVSAGNAGAEPYKGTLVFDVNANLKEQPFYTSAIEGAQSAESKTDNEIGIEIVPENTARVDFINDLVKNGSTHIVGIGFQLAIAIVESAKSNPDVHYTIIGSNTPLALPNIASVAFRNHEGAFLAGMAAAMKSKTGKVGFIGALNIPLVKNFASGFTQGAHYANNKIEVISEIMDIKSNPWNNPEEAEKSAKKLFSEGVDVVFAFTGASVSGVFKAAHDENKMVIGVDGNQNAEHPDVMIASMVKKVDAAVLNSITSAAAGKFVAGVTDLGVKNGAIDLLLNPESPAAFSKMEIARIAKAKKQIAAGKIKVEEHTNK